jgi:hypothetical protein
MNRFPGWRKLAAARTAGATQGRGGAAAASSWPPQREAQCRPVTSRPLAVAVPLGRMDSDRHRSNRGRVVLVRFGRGVFFLVLVFRVHRKKVTRAMRRTAEI